MAPVAPPHKQLHLPIKRVWFDLIIKGKKKTEYREVKPHWTSRIIDPATNKPFHFLEIHFQVGYRVDAPYARMKAGRISQRHGISCKPRNGEELVDMVYFCINLGRVIELRNVPQEIQGNLFEGFK